MKALHRNEAPKVVPLAPPEPANDTKPISVQPKKWRRVTFNRKMLASAPIAEMIIGGLGLSAAHRIPAETQLPISEMALKV